MNTYRLKLSEQAKLALNFADLDFETLSEFYATEEEEEGDEQPE